MATLIGLPIEVLLSVLSDLPNRDIKSVRLACKYLKHVAPLRLDRVFLSPHPQDIKVFEAIAANDTYRERIVEIVYDDTRLPHFMAPWEVHDQDEEDWFQQWEDMDGYDPVPEGIPSWFYRMSKQSIECIDGYEAGRLPRPDLVELAQRLESRLSMKDCYKLYQKIVKEQDKGIEAGADRKALELGLKRFPNLRRLTVTPVAHGIPFIPWYETPMIRSFPAGFVYPIPYGWPEAVLHSNKPFVEPWDSENEKSNWRGLCLVLRTLAQQPHNITEFVLDTNHRYTGFNAYMFHEENPEYYDLVSLLRSPGFSRIDIALFAGGGSYRGWPWYRSSMIKKALMQAKDLRHLSFSGNANDQFLGYGRNFEGAGQHFFPLRSIFPIEGCANLVHFGLSGFVVRLDDLAGFLAALPETLRSVDLSFLCFLGAGGGDHSSLLANMRSELGWRERPVSERPRITLRLNQDQQEAAQFLDVSAAAEDFVYGDGLNPFGEPGEQGGRRGNMVYDEQEIAVKRRSFHPANDLLYAKRHRLMDLGLVKKEDWYLQSEHLKWAMPAKRAS